MGSHVTAVAGALRRATGATESELGDLGIPVDVLACFPGWRSGSRSFKPPRLGLSLAPAGASEPLQGIRLQLSPRSSEIPGAFKLLRGLLRVTEPTVQFALVVQPHANLSDVARVIATFGDRHRSRVRLAEIPTSTTFARDNALSMRQADGTPVLLIPRDFATGTHRNADALSVDQASEALGIRIVRSMLWWEGGNILHDRHACMIGADTVRQNIARLGLSAEQVLRAFAAELGTQVHVLGNLSESHWDDDHDRCARSGQASFHIDLDVALLGRFGRRRKPTALIADPARGLDHLAATLRNTRLIAGSFLPRAQALSNIEDQYEDYARVRQSMLFAYCDALEALGYRVVGMPDLRMPEGARALTSANTHFSYCNVVACACRGRPTVYYLPWGIRSIDEAAREQYARAGVTAIPAVRGGELANHFMQLDGGLHCLCGPWL